MNSRGVGNEFVDFQVRVATPIALEHAGLTAVAQRLRNLDPITDARSIDAALREVVSVQTAVNLPELKVILRSFDHLGTVNRILQAAHDLHDKTR